VSAIVGVWRLAQTSARGDDGFIKMEIFKKK